MEDETTAGKRQRVSMPRSVRRVQGSNGGVLGAVRDAGAWDVRRARWRVTDILRWVGGTYHGGPSRQRGAGGSTATVRQCPLAQWGQRLGSWPVTRVRKACQGFRSYANDITFWLSCSHLNFATRCFVEICQLSLSKGINAGCVAAGALEGVCGFKASIAAAWGSLGIVPFCRA